MGQEPNAILAFGYKFPDESEMPWGEWCESEDSDFEEWYTLKHKGEVLKNERPPNELYNTNKEEFNRLWNLYSDEKKKAIKKHKPKIDVFHLYCEGHETEIIIGLNRLYFGADWDEIMEIEIPIPTKQEIEDIKEGLTELGIDFDGEPKWLLGSYLF